eukprot:7850587-Pyramimonas_sp.AAC.1
MAAQQRPALFGKVGEKPTVAALQDPGVQARKKLAVADSKVEKKADLALKLGVINAQRNRLLEA